MPIEHISATTMPLTDSPINPAWVLGGSPTARSSQWWASRDGRWTYHVWDCTAGRFRWHYAIDESIHVVDGEFRCRLDPADEWLTVSAGESVVFRGGTAVEWDVPRYVRKHAGLRSHALPWRALAKARRMVRARRGEMMPAPAVAL